MPQRQDGNGKEGSKEKRVRFAAYMRIRLGASRKDYTEKDVENCWYSRQEFSHMKNERNIIVLALLQEKKVQQTSHCCRCVCELNEDICCNSNRWQGMFDLDALFYRKQNIDRIRSLVLQQFALKLSSEIVSEVYHECAETAVHIARRNALEDERVAYFIAYSDLDEILDVLAPNRTVTCVNNLPVQHNVKGSPTMSKVQPSLGLLGFDGQLGNVRQEKKNRKRPRNDSFLHFQNIVFNPRW